MIDVFIALFIMMIAKSIKFLINFSSVQMFTIYLHFFKVELFIICYKTMHFFHFVIINSVLTIKLGLNIANFQS